MGYTQGHAELLRFFYHYGLEWQVMPCLIFLGLGAMTDFGPLIANPKTLLIGAGAQLGVFVTFTGTVLAGFTLKEAASVEIIGGAEGPTTIYLTQLLAPQLLGPNALAAYSYMAMVPLIQPPIMRLMTSEKERKIRMRQLRPVSKREKILFPLIGVTVIAFLVPSVIPLMGMFMFGNLMKESGVVDRLANVAQGPLINIVTIFLCVSIGGQHVCGQLFELGIAFHFRSRPDRLYGLHGWGNPDCQDHEPFSQRKDQPTDRFCRSFSRAHVGTCFPSRRAEIRQGELSLDARDGTQPCRCHRGSRCRRNVHCHV